MPHVADEGISQALLMLTPLRRLGIWVHSVRHKEPIDKLIGSDGALFGDEVVDMRWMPVDNPSTPTILDADFVHERIVAGLLFHQPEVAAPANTGKAYDGRAYQRCIQGCLLEAILSRGDLTEAEWRILKDLLVTCSPGM